MCVSLLLDAGADALANGCEVLYIGCLYGCAGMYRKSHLFLLACRINADAMFIFSSGGGAAVKQGQG